MWDNTNIPMYQYSDAGLQRTTWSSYYNMNCAKGGLGMQLCGWMVTASLWTGSVDDLEQQSKSNIFQEQKEFTKNDTPEGERCIP